MPAEVASPREFSPGGEQPRLPAVILVTGSSSLRVAHLTVLDRLIVALHRAGAGPVTLVATGPLPVLERARALGIPIDVQPHAPRFDGPVLVTEGHLLVQAADVRRCIASSSRLSAPDGSLLPLGIAAQPELGLEMALLGLPVTRAEGVAALVTSPASARAAEKALWRSLGSSSDGLVDRVFNRPCGRPVSRLLIHTPVSPNTVSITSILIGVVAAILFADGRPTTAIAAALLFQLSAIVDCVDGEIARVLFKESPMGKWIDLVGDQVVHLSVFAGIAAGLFRSGQVPEAGWLGASAVIGSILSFAVVLRGTRRSAVNQNILQRLIDATTNRDFSVLVLVLAFLQQLGIFLWLAAVGSHLFWIAALALQAGFRPFPQRSAPPK